LILDRQKYDLIISLIYENATVFRVLVVINTSSKADANVLCGMHHQAKIDDKSKWSIGKDRIAKIDWDGLDAWTIDGVKDLIRKNVDTERLGYFDPDVGPQLEGEFNLRKLGCG